MPYDINGNYITTKQDKQNEQSKKNNQLFSKKIDCFLKKHKISGIAYTYGFSTTKPDDAAKKLNLLNVKFRLDKSSVFHTKFIVSKNEKNLNIIIK